MKYKWIIFVFIALLFLIGCEFEDMNFGDAFTVFPGAGKEPKEGEFMHPDSDYTAIVVIPDRFEMYGPDNNPVFADTTANLQSGMDTCTIDPGQTTDIILENHSLHYKGDEKGLRANEVPKNDMDEDYILFQWLKSDSADWHISAEITSVDYQCNLNLELIDSSGNSILAGSSGTTDNNFGNVTLTSNSYYYIRVTYDPSAGPVGYRLIFRPYQ